MSTPKSSSKKAALRQKKQRWRKHSSMSDDSSWRKFEDEDYIVFCFKEDGAFDVLKKENSEASNRFGLVSAGSRPVSRMLNYGEGDEAVKRSSNKEKFNGDGRDFYHTNDGDYIIFPQKDEEGEEEGEEEVENQKKVIDDRTITVPTESSDSNHSDVSNGSFAFPVLGWEWSGSPVQMPKSEGLQMSKQRLWCVGFQCCRF